MRGHRLIIMILISVTLALTTIMVSLNLYESWSQYARSLHEPILFAALSAISSTFLIRSFSHKNRHMVLFHIGRMDVRLEHSNRITGFLFIGILCTPVTHPAWYIETAHLIFTGAAITSAHSELWFYYKKGVKKWGWILGSVLGIAGFIGGFVFHLYSIGMGELIAAIPLLIHVNTTNKI